MDAPEILPMSIMTKGKQFEVHEHCFTRGPRANGWNYKFTHSHTGGSAPHKHAETGPACYGGFKDAGKFTAKPKGEQMPMVDLEDWQKSFDVIVTPWNEGFGEGPGTMAAERMIREFRMKAIVIAAVPKP